MQTLRLQTNLKSHMALQLAFLHLTLAQCKGQRHTHFLWISRKRYKLRLALLMSSNIIVLVWFRLANSDLTFVHSKDKGQDHKYFDATSSKWWHMGPSVLLHQNEVALAAWFKGSGRKYDDLFSSLCQLRDFTTFVFVFTDVSWVNVENFVWAKCFFKTICSI